MPSNEIFRLSGVMSQYINVWTVNPKTLNSATEEASIAVTLLFRIWEVLGSNPDRHSNYLE
jgi:hypothetical protein